MRELDRALADIAVMKSQMARTVVFRGFGPQALAATGALAGIATVVQATWLTTSQAARVADPAEIFPAFLAVWVTTAVLAVALLAIEAIRRSRTAHGRLADDMLRTAVEQFSPAGAAGILLTLVLQRQAPEALWMLPGLWQILLSLGVFAACATLPRPMLLVAVWYLATGLACLCLAQGPAAFSPLAMGLPCSLGQLLAAGLLTHCNRRSHAEA